MAITRKNTASRIANTTMQKVLVNGVHKLFEITPIDGYVLHNKEIDEVITDDTGKEISRKLWYTKNACQCLSDYDFEANDSEFYAVPKNEVDEKCIL